MRKAGIIILLLIVGGFAYGAGKTEEKVWNLEECVSQALAANKDFLIAKEKVKQAKARERAAFAGLLPTLSFSAGYTRLDSSSTIDLSGAGTGPFIPMSFKHNSSLGLTLGYAIPWIPYFSDGAWGAAKKGHKIAKESLKMAEEELVKIRIGTRSTVAKQFYSVLLNQLVFSVTAANQKRLQEYVNVAQRNYNAGRVSQYELLRAQVQLANNTPQLLQAKNNLRLIRITFLQTLGLGLDTKFRLQGRLTAAMVRLAEKKAIRMAFKCRYELKQLQRARTIQKYTIALQKASRRPILTAFGNLSWDQAGDTPFKGGFENSWNVGLQLSIPISEIFPWSKTRHNIKAEESGLRIVDTNIAKVKDGIRLQLRQILLRLKEYKRTIEAQQTAIRLSKKGLDIAKIRYWNGQMGNVELTDANLDYQRAQLNLYRAWFQYISARYDLLMAIGVEKLK